jgi:hypothetical protein
VNLLDRLEPATIWSAGLFMEPGGGGPGPDPANLEVISSRPGEHLEFSSAPHRPELGRSGGPRGAPFLARPSSLDLPQSSEQQHSRHTQARTAMGPGQQGFPEEGKHRASFWQLVKTESDETPAAEKGRKGTEWRAESPQSHCHQCLGSPAMVGAHTHTHPLFLPSFFLSSTFSPFFLQYWGLNSGPTP